MERVAYTEKDLSEQFGIPQRGLYELRRNGYLEGVKLGKHWVYSKTEVERFLKRNLGKKLSTKKAIQDEPLTKKMTTKL